MTISINPTTGSQITHNSGSKYANEYTPKNQLEIQAEKQHAPKKAWLDAGMEVVNKMCRQALAMQEAYLMFG